MFSKYMRKDKPFNLCGQKFSDEKSQMSSYSLSLQFFS